MDLTSRLRALPLERRIALYVFVLLFTVVGAVLVVASNQLRWRTEIVEEQRLERVAARTGELIVNLTRNRGRVLARVARHPAVVAAAAGQWNATPDSARLILEDVGDDAQLLVGLWRPNGGLVVAIGDSEEDTPQLHSDGFFTELARLTADSLRIGGLHATAAGVRHWIAVPVLDQRGRVVGILAEARRISASESVLYGLMRLIGSETPPILVQRDRGVWASLSGELLEPPTAVDSSNGVTMYQRGGEKMLAGVANVEGAPWSVAVDVPHAVALASVRKDIRRLGAIAIVLGGFCVVGALLAGRRIVRPLKQLTTAAEEIARGDYSRRVGVTGPDEVGRLGSAFDEMAERVQHSVEGQRLLQEASSVVASSLGEESGLRRLAELCVPRLADWCSIHLLTADGQVERVETAHRDRSKGALIKEMHDRYPPGLEDEAGPGAAIRCQKPVLMPRIPEDAPDRFAHDTEHREMIRALSPRSYMCVPLIATDRVLGAMSFVISESDREYADEDLAVAMEVGRRAAVAIDNARLYRASIALRLDAESANRAKSDFLATMSHEIRTPINAMVGYAELLEMGVNGPLTERQLQSVARIRSSGAHLVALVNDVLDLSKIEAGRLDVAQVAAPAAEAVEAAVALIRPLAAAKGVTVAEGESGTVGARYFGDPKRVQQIMANLISNAVKFTPAGGEVRIAHGVGPMPSGESRPAGASVYIAVADTGIGIGPGDVDRIFLPFVQVEGGYTRQAGGTGLGLAISKSLAELMNGTLTVESAPGSGSTFTLWLPLATQGKPRTSRSGAGVGAG